jgi:hypothetical protein
MYPQCTTTKLIKTLPPWSITTKNHSNSEKKNNSKNKLSIVARPPYTIHAERATDHPMPRHERHQTLRSCAQIWTIEPRRRQGKPKPCTKRQKLPGRWGLTPGLRRFGHEPFQWEKPRRRGRPWELQPKFWRVPLVTDWFLFSWLWKRSILQRGFCWTRRKKKGKNIYMKVMGMADVVGRGRKEKKKNKKKKKGESESRVF